MPSEPAPAVPVFAPVPAPMPEPSTPSPRAVPSLPETPAPIALPSVIVDLMQCSDDEELEPMAADSQKTMQWDAAAWELDWRPQYGPSEKSAMAVAMAAFMRENPVMGQTIVAEPRVPAPTVSAPEASAPAPAPPAPAPAVLPLHAIEQPESPPKKRMEAIDLVEDTDEKPSPKRSRWALQLADTIVPKVQQMDSSSMAAIDALRVPQPAGQMELAVPQPAPARAGLAASVEPDVQVEQPDEVSPAEDDLEEAPAPKPAGQKRRSQLAPAPA